MIALSSLKAHFDEIHRCHVGVKDDFMSRTEMERAELLRSIAEARDRLLDGCLENASPQARASPLFASAIQSLRRYASASDWSLIDAVNLALCLEPGLRGGLVRQLAETVLAFHALRMVDDVIDGHLSYKTHYQTMYGELMDHPALRPVAADVTLITALLVLSEGVGRYPSILGDLQRTILGALHERVATDPGAEYDSIILGKMVSYGLVLYWPVLASTPEEARPPVASFLRESFRLGQLLNDLLDREQDRESNQPNFWNLHPHEGVDLLVGELTTLAAQADALPWQFRPYGATRVVDLAGYGNHILRPRGDS
jgi:hypothetical protein